MGEPTALTLLHITDLHFGWDGADTNKRAERDACLTGLLAAVSTLERTWKPAVICLSGDIGWHGAATDYVAAKEWLDRLLDTCGIGYDKLIVCAGNHDAARAEAEKNARPDDASKADEALRLPIGSQYAAPFTQLVEFCTAAGIVPLKIGEDESYLVGQRLLYGYRFVGLNSAWFCKDVEDEKQLWLGLPHLRALELARQLPLVRGKSDVPCTIALVHHPKEWLHADESHAWERRPNTWDYLAGRCHVLLTGHTHGEVRRADRVAESALHFTGGSAYTGASHFNSFRLLRLEPDQLRYVSYEFNPRSADNEWRALHEIALPFAEGGQNANAAQVTNRTRWLENYAKTLEAKFLAHLSQHERLDGAAAESRFIEVLTRERPHRPLENETTESEPRPISNLAAEPGVRALVLGGGGSGKTSILRKLAVDCCRAALVDSQAPLPLFGRLNFFDTHTDVVNGLLDIVAREAGLSRDDVDRVWCDSARRCLFLLDGLNEVRPEFAGDCRLAIQRLTEHNQHNYLITSRPGDAAAELRKQVASLREVEVVQLDPSQIKTYLERVGAGDLYDRLEERLLSLARRPFLLWAIAQSCAGLPDPELPRNLGQLYENLIDRYIFGVYEESKPKETRPTRYNYQLVKKPVVARLAARMCRQGATRCTEDTATLASTRDHLHELREANAGLRPLLPHEFMPEPFAKAFLDELVENGILHRQGTTLEFMHESVRDYFAATEVSRWPVHEVLQNVSPLVWRGVEPGYDELPVEGTFFQALIMSCGLRTDAEQVLRALVEHHPLLAAHCFAGATDIGPDVRDHLLKQWLGLLDRRLDRYRWIGCQCLRASNVRSTVVARRLFDVLLTDPVWSVRKSAARALGAIDDPEVTKELVEHALNDPPDKWGSTGNVASQFRHLQTDTIIVALLRVWGDPAETDARKRRVEQVFAGMRRSAVRQALSRLAGDGDTTTGQDDTTARLAEAALKAFDAWKVEGIPHADDATDFADHYEREFQNETTQLTEQMSTWSREDLVRVIRDPSPAKRAAAARTLAVRHDEAVPVLLDALASEMHGRVVDALLEALGEVGQPDTVYTAWQARLRDGRWPYLFSVGREFAEDLKDSRVSERWANEFEKRQLKGGSYFSQRRHDWVIGPRSYAGDLHESPLYSIALRGPEIDVFDAGMRPRLVAAAQLMGPRALPVLKELLDEKDDLLQLPVAKVLAQIPTPDAIPLLSTCLSETTEPRAAKDTIQALAATGSKLAVQPLVDALCTSGAASDWAAEIGDAVGVLGGVATLIRFAHEQGNRGDPRLRAASVAALRGSNEKSPATEAIFVSAAGDDDPAVRREAVRGLAALQSSQAESKLLDVCTTDSDAEVRQDAGKALRQFPGETAIGALIAALDSAENDIRVRAAEALECVQDDAAIPALVKLLEATQPLPQIAAAKALHALGFSQSEALIDMLCPLARTAPDPEVRQVAAKVLREIPNGEDALYRSIREALTAGRPEDVEALIGVHAPFLPDDANLYWWRAVARLALKRPEEALADLDEAIRLTTFVAVVHRTRAEVLAELNRLPEAFAAAEMAVQTDVDDPDNHFVLGWIALASGRVAEAVTAYDRGIALCTELEPDRALREFDGALEGLEELIREHPECAPQAEETKHRLHKARLQVVSATND